MDLEDIGLSLMVGNRAYRNSYIHPLHFRDVSRAALAALEQLGRLVFIHDIKRIEFAFPYPYGRVKQLNESVGQKVDAMMEKYQATVHLPMAPIHTLDGTVEVIAGLNYGIEHGAKQFVVHPTEVEWKWFWSRSQPLDFAKAREHGLLNIENILDEFGDKDIIIGIENLAGPVPHGKLDHLFGKHGQLTAGWCLDTCHMFNALSGFNDYDSCREIIVKLIKEYSQKDQLVEVHLTDTKAIDGKDRHCALGQGNVPLDAILEALCSVGFNGPIIVEVDNKDFVPSWAWLHEDR